MKKIFAVLAVLAISSFSLTASAACGTNTSRNTPTRAPGAPTTSTPSSGNADVAVPAGTPR